MFGHRVAIASGGASAGEARAVFQPQALHAIHRLSGGIPRTVNLLCDRALTVGCAGGRRVIDPLLVRRAAESLDLPRNTRSAPPLLTRLRRRVASAAMASGLSGPRSSALLALAYGNWRLGVSWRRRLPRRWFESARWVNQIPLPVV